MAQMIAAALSPARRTALRVALTVMVLLALAAGALAFGFPPWLRARVQAAAAQQGVALDFEDFELTWGLLTLHRVSFEQERPLHTRGSAEHVRVQLDGFQPRSITLQTPSIDLLASHQELLAQLNAPTPEITDQQQPAVPVTAENLTFNWRPTSAALPLVSLGAGSLSLQPSSVELAGHVAISGLPVGELQLSWDRKQQSARVAATSALWPNLHLSANAKFGSDPLSIVATLPETPLPVPLSLLLGVPALKTASVSARVELRWPLGLSMQTPGGTALVTLKNFEPPHPAELQGFDFGTQTDLATDYSLSRDHKKVTLKNIRVQAGSFALTGDGSLDPSKGRVTLQGSLSCAVLAKAAAEARVGSVLGVWAGQLAGKIALHQVEGKVAFEVDTELAFDGKSLPRVDKRVFPGCGLKPLKLEELAKLQPADLDLADLGARLREMLPDLTKLPAAPNLLPGASAQPGQPLPIQPWPTLPGFGTQRRQLAPAAASSPAPAPSSQP
jgi:hypothetical protein